MPDAWDFSRESKLMLWDLRRDFLECERGLREVVREPFDLAVVVREPRECEKRDLGRRLREALSRRGREREELGPVAVVGRGRDLRVDVPASVGRNESEELSRLRGKQKSRVELRRDRNPAVSRADVVHEDEILIPGRDPEVAEL